MTHNKLQMIKGNKKLKLLTFLKVFRPVNTDV